MFIMLIDGTGITTGGKPEIKDSYQSQSRCLQTHTIHDSVIVCICCMLEDRLNGVKNTNKVLSERRKYNADE